MNYNDMSYVPKKIYILLQTFSLNVVKKLADIRSPFDAKK